MRVRKGQQAKRREPTSLDRLNVQKQRVAPEADRNWLSGLFSRPLPNVQPQATTQQAVPTSAASLGWEATPRPSQPYLNPRRDSTLNGTRDGLSLFRSIKARLAAGEDVQLIADLDNTVADTVLGRHRLVLEKLDAKLGTNHAQKLRREHVTDSWQETAQRLSLSTAEAGAFGRVWEETFFSEEAIATDEPLPEMVELLQSTEAPLEFLTGRWTTLQASSDAQVRRFGFGDVPAHHKPPTGYQERGGTPRFKAEFLNARQEQLAREGRGGELIFVSDWRAEIAAIQKLCPNVTCVLLDSTFSVTAEEVDGRTYVLPPLIAHPPEPLSSLLPELKAVATTPHADPGPILERVEKLVQHLESMALAAQLWGKERMQWDDETLEQLAALKGLLHGLSERTGEAQALAARLP
jgi:hypothetical protein